MDTPPEEVSAFVVKDGGAVVVSCVDSLTDKSKWWVNVAWEFHPATVIFVWFEEGKWTAWKVDKGQRSMPSKIDLELVAAVLARERKLTPGDHVVFRREVPDASTTVVENLDIEVPQDSSIGTPEQVLTNKGMAAWIKKQNAKPRREIVLSLRSPTGVIPFLGAGMSADFKYPLWRDFFEKFATAAADGDLPGVSKEFPRQEKNKVFAHVKKKQFEKAAKILVEWDEKEFYKKLEKDYGDEPDLAGKDTPLTRLPLIAPGPIITTNVDPVIEAVYKKMGKPFPRDRRILGAKKHADQVVTALQQNLRALIKLHGDVKDTDSLIFTEIEYKEGYGNTDNPGPIERLATVIYTNRPLLFLGCSLTTDRTLKSLKNVYKRNPYVGHYAVVEASFRSTRRDEKIKELHDGAGIRLLWYPPTEHRVIDALLKDLVSRTALDEIRPPATPQPAVPGVSPITAITPGDEQPDRFRLTQDHIESVTKALVGGTLVFSFGSAVHTNRMRGDQLYEQICSRASIPWPRRDRTDAAQYVADVDRTELSRIVKQLIQANCRQPCRAHRFVAKLPAKLKELGHNSNLMVITTNYDAMTEVAFADAQQPYHLFVYNHYGLYAGRFLHRRPDGHVFAIRTPAAVDEPLDAPAIVKLNGGLDPLERLPETFVVASSDFEELSTRLPDVLPQVVWDALKKRSVLFLGHGLAEPDVRSLIRRRKDVGAPPSWAVQKKVDKADAPYLRRGGVEPIQGNLNAYLNRLESALTAYIPSVP
jgi:hypothetical protein